MSTMFVTVWDSYTNDVEQHYVEVTYGDHDDATIKRGRTPIIVHERICALMGRDPKEYELASIIRPLDNAAQETGVLVCVVKHHDVEISTYSCLWHF